MKFFISIILSTAVLVTSSYGHDFKEDDEIGAANFLTPDVVLQAKSEIVTGKVYQLGITISETTEGPGGRRTINTMLPLKANKKETFVDDYLVGHLSVGTQIDGLGHAIIGGKGYNGKSLDENLGLNGIKKLGVETIPPFVTRGVMLNIANLLGVDYMQPGQAITDTHIKDALKKQNVTLRKGDVVLLHTGWMNEKLVSDPNTYVNIEPGLSVEGAAYLAAQDVVAVGIDVAQLDPIDVPTNYNRPAHGVLLVANGVFILENVNTTELARDDVSTFMMVFGVIRYEGAAQTQINPVAIR